MAKVSLGLISVCMPYGVERCLLLGCLKCISSMVKSIRGK